MHVFLRTVAVAAALTAMFTPGCECGLEPLAAQPGSLAGVACDPATGLPITIGDVVVESAGERLPVRTDEAGNYVVNRVPAGDAQVVLPGDRRVTVSVIPGATVDVTDTACRDLAGLDIGSVTGQVCNGHVGIVVQNADVLVILPDNTRLTTTTDAEGRFSFAEVPAGSHGLSVRGDGFSRSEVITVVGGEETIVDVGGACAIPAPGEVGGVRGRVCTPDGAQPLVDARASIAPAGVGEIANTTDVDGRFLLEGVPAGDQLLVIQKGTFRSERTVTIPAGSILQLDEQECAIQPDAIRIAVVRGSEFDHVEQVLGSIGIDEGNIDIYGADWAETLLGADERIRDYDILFLNCRSTEPVYLASSAMRATMVSFVEAGGSLFASDQAYDLIERTFPSRIDFQGNDDTLGAADKGAATVGLTASVVDNTMRGLFGRSTATLAYPLGQWSVIADVANGVDVYLVADAPLAAGGDVNEAPQIVGFHQGNGRVTYSSFHQEPGSHPDQLRILQLLMFEL